MYCAYSFVCQLIGYTYSKPVFKKTYFKVDSRLKLPKNEFKFTLIKSTPKNTQNKNKTSLTQKKSLKIPLP